MRISEITRRGAMIGSLAALGGAAHAGPGGQHLPPEFDEDLGKAWNKLSPREKAMWQQRQKTLYARSVLVLNKLLSVMSPEEQEFVRGVKINVPIKAALYDRARVGPDKIIEVDLGTFWDLSNDTLGYTIGHELGHIYYNATKLHPFFRTWETPAKKRLKVQMELDCDKYGAILAYKAGFNPQHAFRGVSEEDKKWRYNPNVQGQNYYPDHPMRKSAFDKTIKQLQSEPAAPGVAPAASQPASSPTSTQPDQQVSMAKHELFRHILRGINAMYT